MFFPAFRISHTMASSGFRVSALVNTKANKKVKRVVDSVLSDGEKQTSDNKYRKAYKRRNRLPDVTFRTSNGQRHSINNKCFDKS